MELNLNREFIKGAVNMALWFAQQAGDYPNNAFTFNVIKEGNFWELQFIYVTDVFEVASGVEHSGRYEMIPDEKTDSFKKEIPQDCTIEDLALIVSDCMEEIIKREYKQ